jgi:aspartyl/asparaginyl beta-hydroxylase (cupin superfamily)
MFIDPQLSKINTKTFTDNYNKIREDYIKLRDGNFFIDYSHEYDMNVEDLNDLIIPQSTGHFWQVSPLIINRQVIPQLPKEVRELFTTKLLMSYKIKPILAVFSILEPRSEIDPHSDYDDMLVMKESQILYPGVETSVVKYHYSLDIPEDGECALIVGNEKRILKNRDLNPFDETTTHWAYNKSSKRRGVLIVSYLRQELYDT